MAKCNLSVRLDEPDRIYQSGDQITGTVQVRVDADVTCSGLQIQSGWTTHGKGNVKSGVAGTITAFSGTWTAGQTLEYRFELPVAAWPPTYHGNYLNVDHQVEAQAKIPWSFDPKAAAKFRMIPLADAGVQAALAGQKNRPNPVAIAVILGAVGLVLVVMVILVGNALFTAVAFGGVTLLASILFFVKVLPRWLLGNVQVGLQSTMVTPASQVIGELVVQPNRNVTINGITAIHTVHEICVSGSGSNRRTHTHTVGETTRELAPAGTIHAGGRRVYGVVFDLPADTPYSVELDDNRLVHTIKFRIDLPRWPDWTESIPLAVVPSQRPVVPPSIMTPLTETDDTEAAVPPSADDDITFAETAGHFMALQGDTRRSESLAEALIGLSFTIQAYVERRLLYSGEEDPHAYPDGHAVWAYYPDPPLPLVLYIPGTSADEFEQVGRELWTGRGTIVGFDGRHGRLQLKVD